MAGIDYQFGPPTSSFMPACAGLGHTQTNMIVVTTTEGGGPLSERSPGNGIARDLVSSASTDLQPVAMFIATASFNPGFPHEEVLTIGSLLWCSLMLVRMVDRGNKGWIVGGNKGTYIPSLIEAFHWEA